MFGIFALNNIYKCNAQLTKTHKKQKVEGKMTLEPGDHIIKPVVLKIQAAKVIVLHPG